jgi:hypothetical protein
VRFCGDASAAAGRTENRVVLPPEGAWSARCSQARWCSRRESAGSRGSCCNEQHPWRPPAIPSQSAYAPPASGSGRTSPSCSARRRDLLPTLLTSRAVLSTRVTVFYATTWTAFAIGAGVLFGLTLQ